MLIPIGDWNCANNIVEEIILCLKSCLSPLGIETVRHTSGRKKMKSLKSCLSPLGIETAQRSAPPVYSQWFEIMLIPIGDWNQPDVQSIFVEVQVWNHAYPHWGLKPYWCSATTCRPEVWNHAYPHWGLKLSGAGAGGHAGVGLKSCLSPLGIETAVSM